MLSVASFRTVIWRLSRGPRFVALETWAAWCWIDDVIILFYSWNWLFRRRLCTLFHFFHWSVYFTSQNYLRGFLNEIEVKTQFGNLSHLHQYRTISWYGHPTFLWRRPYAAGPPSPAQRLHHLLIQCSSTRSGTTSIICSPAILQPA